MVSLKKYHPIRSSRLAGFRGELKGRRGREELKGKRGRGELNGKRGRGELNRKRG